MVIFRYLSKELYINLLAITLVLLIIFITNQFVHYLKVAASGEITMMAVMKLMSLQVPLLLGYLLPLGLYLSILLAFGRLYMDYEMTVLFACGVSRAKLMGMVMVFAALLAVFVAWLMLWVEPTVQGFRNKVLDEAITQASIAKVVPGRFQSLGHGSVFYAEKLSRRDKNMYDVFLAQKRKNQGPDGENGWDITTAAVASERDNYKNLGRFLIFKQGKRYIGVPGQKEFQEAIFDQYGIQLTPKSGRHSDWPMDAPTTELWQKRNSNRRAAAALQWRLAMPISVFLFALLAVPLSEVNPRRGKFAQLIPAIIIYIGYADLMFLGRAWIEKGTISSTLGLWWIHALALLLAAVLIVHRSGWRRILLRKS